MSRPEVARAADPPPCYGVRAYARPGPVHAGQAAVLVSPIDDDEPLDPSLLTFTDGAGNAIAFDTEARAAGSVFLRAHVELAPGIYNLRYAPACAGNAPIEVPLQIDATAEDPSSIGALSVSYDPTCADPNLAVEMPPVTVTLTLSDAAKPYNSFLDLDVTDDQGMPWSRRDVDASVTYEVGFERDTYCSPISASADNRHGVTLSASIVDGPVLPPLSVTADTSCPTCVQPTGCDEVPNGCNEVPPAPNDGGPPGDAGSGPEPSDAEPGSNSRPLARCALGARSDGGDSVLVALAFVASVVARRRSAGRRAAPGRLTRL